MRRSLRKIDTKEVGLYPEAEQLFTVDSLEAARQRLIAEGHDPATYCFFTWMRDGVRYYRVWEDKRLKTGVVQVVPFGQEAARLKRAEAEKLYTLAKRFAGERVELSGRDGVLTIIAKETGTEVAAYSLPLVGGSLICEPRQWSERQAAHFLNVLLVRGQQPDVAFAEANSLQ